MRGSGTLGLTIVLALSVRPANATDSYGVRASAGFVGGQQAFAETATLGYTRQWFIDNFGLRASVDAGYLHYVRGGRASRGFGDLELALYRGADNATFRPYLVIAPLFSLSSEVFEGLRAGFELEWRDVCSPHGLSIAAGMFFQPMRNAAGLDSDMIGPRLTLTWERPTLGCVEASHDELPGKNTPPNTSE